MLFAQLRTTCFTSVVAFQCLKATAVPAGLIFSQQWRKKMNYIYFIPYYE